MALGREVHLLLQHALVDGADRPLRSAIDLAIQALGLAKRVLRNRAAVGATNRLGAMSQLVAVVGLAGLLGPVRVTDRQPDDGDRVVHARDRVDARDTPAGTDDDGPADPLADDPVGASDVAGALRRDRRRLQAEAGLPHRRRGLVADAVVSR